MPIPQNYYHFITLFLLLFFRLKKGYLGITRCPSKLATIMYSLLTLILTRVVISLGFSVIMMKNVKVALCLRINFINLTRTNL
ncbi:transmembrane protein, putative [Medicago truncatula]|uniref:Transmembrane protein, putative n=1 Tax=Medicago truncatula TaxID=3880 RepID=A0A072UB81_MEDTR|nr:transmembrane protein, putative [Medicago truncatula]